MCKLKQKLKLPLLPQSSKAQDASVPQRSLTNRRAASISTVVQTPVKPLALDRMNEKSEASDLIKTQSLSRRLSHGTSFRFPRKPSILEKLLTESS